MKTLLIVSRCYSVCGNNWYFYLAELIRFFRNLFMQTLVKLIFSQDNPRKSLHFLKIQYHFQYLTWQEIPSWVFHFSTSSCMHLRFYFRPHFNIWKMYLRVAKLRVWLMSCSLTSCSQAGKLARNALFHELLYLLAPDCGERKNCF